MAKELIPNHTTKPDANGSSLCHADWEMQDAEVHVEENAKVCTGRQKHTAMDHRARGVMGQLDPAVML